MTLTIFYHLNHTHQALAIAIANQPQTQRRLRKWSFEGRRGGGDGMGGAWMTEGKGAVGSKEKKEIKI